MNPNPMQGNQGYAQWYPWGQGNWQQQEPWNVPQPGCDWQTPPDYRQGQEPWNMYPPGYGWQAQADYRQEEQAWDMYQPAYDWQDQPSDSPEDPFAAFEAVQPIKKREHSKIVNRILNLLTYSFIAFLLVGSTMFAFSNNADKSLFGYRFYNVLTPSMQPFFKPGDLIFVKLVDTSQVRVGDVVTFNPSAKSTAFLTHRVVDLLPADETYPARMVTKGDYNNAEDPPVGLSAVIGVHVFTIPVFGRVIDMMRSNLLLLCVCFGAVFLLFAVLRAYASAGKQKMDIHAL